MLKLEWLSSQGRISIFQEVPYYATIVHYACLLVNNAMYMWMILPQKNYADMLAKLSSGPISMILPVTIKKICEVYELDK